MKVRTLQQQCDYNKLETRKLLLITFFLINAFFLSIFVVCESFLQRFQDYAGDDISDLQASEVALKEFCKTVSGKDESFVSLALTQTLSD